VLCVQWAYPGVPFKLAQLVKHGHTVAIFNNQGNIRGALTGKVRTCLVPAACPTGRRVPACHALACAAPCAVACVFAMLYALR
jgi:hypothetical protein